MAQIIEKIVKSKFAPNNTNVVWLDTKDNTLKSFTNKGWEKVKGQNEITIKEKKTKDNRVIVGRYIPEGAVPGARYYNSDNLIIKIKNKYYTTNLNSNRYCANFYILVTGINSPVIFTVPDYITWNTFIRRLQMLAYNIVDHSNVDPKYDHIFIDLVLHSYELYDQFNSWCKFGKAPIHTYLETTSPYVKVVNYKLVINKPLLLQYANLYNNLFIKINTTDRYYKIDYNWYFYHSKVFIYKYKRCSRRAISDAKKVRRKKYRYVLLPYRSGFYIDKPLLIKIIPKWRGRKGNNNAIISITKNYEKQSDKFFLRVLKI